MTCISRNDKYIVLVQSSAIAYLIIEVAAHSVSQTLFEEQLSVNCVQLVMFILVKLRKGKT